MMRMLVTLVFPFLDNRLYLPNSDEKITRPSWTQAIIGEFVRSIGAMDQKVRGNTLAESSFCLSRRALIFGELPSFPIPENLHAVFDRSTIRLSGSPHQSGRRLYYDGQNLGRFEVTLEIPTQIKFAPEDEPDEYSLVEYKLNQQQRFDKLILRHELLDEIIAFICNIDVVVAPKKMHEKTIKLIHAGGPLAQHFSWATTRQTDRDPSAEKQKRRSCLPGRPLVIIRLGPGNALPPSIGWDIEGSFGYRSFYFRTMKISGISAYFIALIDRSPPYIETKSAREFRFLLSRYHAAAQCTPFITRRKSQGGLAGGDLRDTLHLLDKLLEQLRRRAGDLAIDRPELRKAGSRLRTRLGAQNSRYAKRSETKLRLRAEHARMQDGEADFGYAEEKKKYADVLLRVGKLQEAELAYEAVLAILESKCEEGVWQKRMRVFYLSEILNKLAFIKWTQGDLAEAENLYRRAYAADMELSGRDAYEVRIRDLNNIAAILQWRGRSDEAEVLARQSLEILERQAAYKSRIRNLSAKIERSADLTSFARKCITVMSNLSVIIAQAGREREADELTKRALQIEAFASMPMATDGIIAPNSYVLLPNPALSSAMKQKVGVDERQVQSAEKERQEAHVRIIAMAKQIWGDPAKAAFDHMKQVNAGKEGISAPGRLVQLDQADVFISYRRADELSFLIYERLRDRIGPERIFFDRKNIGPGEPFPDAIRRAVSSSKIVLALIGANWLGKTAKGTRINAPNDWVRQELELALSHEKIIIPVLCNRRAFPKDLPVTLGKLSEYNAIVIDIQGEVEFKLTTLVDEVMQRL